MYKHALLTAFVIGFSLVIAGAVNAQDMLPPTQRLGTGIPTSLAASPDGKTLAVGSSIGVWLLDATTLQPAGFWETGFWVEGVVYSEDGRYLDAGAGVIDTTTGRMVSVEAGSIRWQSPNCSAEGLMCARETSQYSVTNLGNGVEARKKYIYSTIVFNTQTMVDLKVLHWPTLDVAWSPDGTTLYAVAGGTIEKWDVRTWTVQRVKADFFTGQLWEVFWSADSAQIASGSSIWNVKTAQLSDTRTCWQRIDFECSKVVAGPPNWHFKPYHVSGPLAQLRTDTRYYVTSGIDRVKNCLYSALTSCQTDAVSTRVWDVKSYSQLASLPTLLHDLVLSPDGRLIAGHSSAGLEVWNWQSGTRLFSVPEMIGYRCNIPSYVDRWCYDPSFGTVFNPSGKYVATFANAVDTDIRLWDAATGEQVATLTGHTIPSGIPKEIYQSIRFYRNELDEVGPVTGIAFSPDGSKIAASSGDGTILIWNVP